ncbi:GGDEF domain-containing protein, partial [Escherichia coli]|nr:GGDEF domain-containing protein [Escherichia coli]
HLSEISRKDGLTGLFNRAFWEQSLKDEFAHLKVIDGPCSLVIFDIDHFKVINDKYGHLAGDEALLHVTKLVNANLNAGDRFYRAGGDEFCILSTVTDTEELEAYLEKLRGIVASSSFDYEEASIICTLSIGAVVHHDEDPENLYHKMDAKLYLSKENGRNTVSIGD